MKRVKVLYFVDRLLVGGIQTFVTENMKYIDREKVQIDYLVLDDGEKHDLENQIEKMGSKIFKLEGVWLNKPLDFIKYCKALNVFFKNNNLYDVVHLHSSSKNFMVLYYAKKYGIRVRVAHSHNIGFQSKNKFKVLLGDLLKKPLIYYATDYFACSKMAGEWLFGKKRVENNEVVIVHNAVDLNKFKYSTQKRNEIRSSLKIPIDNLVIGHVGRFSNQKNHSFLIDIFNEISKRIENVNLLLIGAGELEEKIKNKVKELGLEKKVIFAGFKTNVHDYMNAMDIFLFPSKYEGLGLVLIEAQANGLKSFTSANTVPYEAKVTSLLEYISLDQTASFWAKQILHCSLERKDENESIIRKGYRIEDTAKILEEFYLKL